MSAAPVLVLGAGGWIGQAVRDVLARRGLGILAPSRTEVDVARPGDVGRVLAASGARAVLHLAARQPGSAAHELTRVNVEGARAVAAAAAHARVRLVHVSSDAIWDGRAAPYREDAPPSPLTPYGRSKAEGEAAVRAACPAAACVRTSLSFDPAVPDPTTLAFAERLRRGEATHLFTDEVRCPLPRHVLAEALVDLVDLPWAGPLHVAGREALTRHAFGSRLLEHFGVPGRGRVEAVAAAALEARGAEPRPRDLTLCVAQAEALLGRTLPGALACLRAGR